MIDCKRQYKIIMAGITALDNGLLLYAGLFLSLLEFKCVRSWRFEVQNTYVAPMCCPTICAIDCCRSLLIVECIYNTAFALNVKETLFTLFYIYICILHNFQK
jgi:hypothetical protein